LRRRSASSPPDRLLGRAPLGLGDDLGGGRDHLVPLIGRLGQAGQVGAHRLVGRVLAEGGEQDHEGRLAVPELVLLDACDLLERLESLA
jgi:hypothetical protein